MNRLKQMAGALMLLVPLAACDEGTPPPPTGSIEGTVMIEGTGADGVTVTLNDGTTTTTAGGGAYRFTGVEGGAYTITISGYPSDASFDATQATATIASANQVVQVNFSGSYIRTSSILGVVTLEGAGLSGLSVALSGMSEGTTTTASDGAFAFTGLRAGTYTVEVSGYDSEAYSFSNTTQSATVGVGASAEMSFEGTHIRTASIRGTVMVGEVGLSGVQVSLKQGQVDIATAETDDAGSYGFENLQAGSYTVTISGFNDREYGFARTTLPVENLGVGKTANLNFEGTALRNGGITGRLYLDEANRNDQYDAAPEDEALEVAGVMVTLTGPGVAETQTTMTDSMGMYGFDSLAAGRYRVMISDSAAMANKSLPSYLAYKGKESYLLPPLEASGTAVQDFPYMIKMQKVMVKAMYGADSANMGGPAAGVKIDLHATTAAAQAGGKGSLGTMTTDSMGYAMFMFDRADDTGPGGGLVYARAQAMAMTMLSVDDEMAIEYAPTEHDVMANDPFMVLSTQAMLEFSVANRSNDGNSGGDPMAKWEVHVRMDSATADPMDTLTVSAKGMVAMAYDSVMRNEMFYIRVPGGTMEAVDTAGNPTESQDTALTKGESFKAMATAGEDGTVMAIALDDSAATPATSFLVYKHTGLEPPGTKMDVGMIHVTYTTQTLIVGVHQERDNVDGFSDISPGDVRPTGTDLGTGDIKIQLFEKDAVTGYPTEVKNDEGEDLPAKAVTAGTGTAMWTGLDSDMDLIVEASITGNKVAIGVKQLNVHGDLHVRDDDGTMGIFGGGGGLTPRVYFCPETRRAGKPPQAYMDECSTFAYKFNDGAIVVHTRSKNYGTTDSPVFVQAGAQQIAVKALPNQRGVESPKDKTTAAATGLAAFPGLVDGKYEVTTAGDKAGNWDFTTGASGKDTITVLGGVAAPARNDTLIKTMTFQKTLIQGNVVRDGWPGDPAANDAVGVGETRAGLKVNLVTGSGRNAKVVATGMTDRNGEFEIEAPEGTYRVGGPSGDDYILCHKRAAAPAIAAANCSNHSTNARVGVLTDTLTTTAQAGDSIYTRDTTLPGWSPWDQSIDDGGDDTDFVVLFASSVLTGNVEKIDNSKTPPDTTGYEGVEVHAFRCLTITPGATLKQRCTAFESRTRPYKVVETDSGGDWEMTGLLEGGYRIELAGLGTATIDPVNYETANDGPASTPLRGEEDVRRNLNFHVALN